jgi:hypothetical protein
MTEMAPEMGPFSRGWRYVARSVAGLGILAVLAIVTIDQSSAFVASARAAQCFEPATTGADWSEHILLAGPFVLIFGALVVSLCHRASPAFLVTDSIVLVILLLYLAFIVPDRIGMPDAGDCALDEWGDYGVMDWLALFFIVWPSAIISLCVAFNFWIEAPATRRDCAANPTDSPR